MTDGMTTDDAADGLVRGLVEILSDSGERSIPAASTDAEEVIRTQLTENTGRHLLDSGGAYGRNWEENRENPPWERPAWNVEDQYVVHNVHDWMLRQYGRDRSCVALEVALYGYGYADERKSESWLSAMEGFAEAITGGHAYMDDLIDVGVPEMAADEVAGIAAKIGDDGHDPFTFNTYSGECHTLSQNLQVTAFGGPYAEYVMVQVHGGADIRGGYTAPRVYRTEYGGAGPHELSFRCESCDWTEAESVLYGNEDLLYQPSIDAFELEEKGWLPPEEDAEGCHPALDAAHDADHIDGAVFHRCREEPGHFGHVTFN